MANPAAALLLTAPLIDRYLQDKLAAGVTPASAAKYKAALLHLDTWLGPDKTLSPFRLQAWRSSLEEHGYGKITVQRYVAVVNNFLRCAGFQELCLPKPARNDLTGRTFGYLTAMAPTENRHHKYVVWHCRCKCGRETDVPSSMLLRGCTTSCGCLNMEILQHRNRYEEGTELRQSLEERIHNPNSLSGYVGVQPKRGKWNAYIFYKGVRHDLGTYSKIEDAVKARARAKEAVMEDAARIYEETDHLYGASPRRPLRPQVLSGGPSAPSSGQILRRDNTSGCAGVTRSKGKWSASISVNRVRYCLGTYENLEDAVCVRKQAEALAAAGALEALKALCSNRPEQTGACQNTNHGIARAE